jgi:hypothetical protein
MAEELFNLIFRGDIVAGFNLPDVKASFAQMFKLDPAKVDAYFMGKPTILKKDCDRATADKFQAAMQRIGAVLDVRSVAPAGEQPSAQAAARPQSAPAQQSIPAQQSTPAQQAAAPARPAVSTNPWSLSAQGSTLIRPDEIVQPEPVKVDITHISLTKRNPFAMDAEEPLEADHSVPPPKLDLSGLELGKAGEPLVEFQEFVPRAIDLSELSLAAAGSDVLRPDEREIVVPVQVDTSELNLASPGGDLGQIAPPPAPPAPPTDHLSIQK